LVAGRGLLRGFARAGGLAFAGVVAGGGEMLDAADDPVVVAVLTGVRLRPPVVESG
jgi:hypothetical protein